MLPLFLQAQNIEKAYGDGAGKHTVLRGVSLDIARGETLALLGRSGSGKSTLLNLLAGIDDPDRGQLILDGVDIATMTDDERTLFRRQHVGFIYQFFNLIPTLTAAENVSLVLELNGWRTQELTNKTAEILDRVNLLEVSHKFPDQLSGGEQQRVAIARAVVHSPKLILADELTGNLDAEIGHQVLQLLAELVSEREGTLVLVTHSLEVAATADRILTLEDGVLTENGKNFAW